MPASGVPLSVFIERHREEGVPIPLDVCLVIAAAMARARSIAAVIDSSGDIEATPTESSLRDFGEAVFELLTLTPYQGGNPDIGEQREEAPAPLVELMFELLGPEPDASWDDVAERLENMRDEVEGSARELARYMRQRFAAPPPVTRDRHALLGGALDEELARFDLRIAQVWQLGFVGLVVIAVVAAFTASRDLGLWSAAGGCAFFGWFTLHASLLKAGRAGPWLTLANIIIESLMPWAFLVIGFLTDGASYALSSWAAPLLVTFVIGLSIVRLRPMPPIIVGAVGAVMLPLLYFTLLRDGLSAEEATNPAFQGTMQITRGAAIALGGVLAGLVTWALRNAIGKAERTQRQRELFGKYRLLEPIGSGGMGAVYEALYCPEGGFERRVAVKKIHPHLAGEPKFVNAFRREAELSARLAHPNIVQVLDFGQVEGNYFLALEFVDGATLRDLMALRPQLSPQLVAFIGHELLAGTAHAHAGARGIDGAPLRIIHRDMSPSNVLLSRNGEVKITDYGVAKALHQATQAVTATVAGHYGYMAPEQAASDPLDERCDLFAIGVIMWELLVGRRLFGRDEPAATLLAVLNDDIAAPSELRAELDPAWDALLETALQRDPEQRYASASEMRAALEPILAAEGGPCAATLGTLVSEAAERLATPTSA